MAMGQNEKGTRLTEPWVESFLEKPMGNLEGWRNLGFHILGCMAHGKDETGGEDWWDHSIYDSLRFIYSF